MLTTTGFKNFGFEFKDTTVTALPGTVRLGNILYKFEGSRTTLNALGSFAGDSSSYQNVLLFLTDASSAVDMTRTISSTVSSLRELDNPAMTGNATYSPNYPLGLFTLYSPDGTQAELVSYIES